MTEPTYTKNKTCAMLGGNYCFNPVEDTIRAWGREIEPVNCVMHRKRNREIAYRNSDAFRVEQVRKHYANHETCYSHNTAIPCTAFDW